MLITVGIVAAYAAQTISDRIEIDNDDIPAAINAGDLFGYQIVAITDIDSNGTIDLAVIKFSDDSNEADVGSILILFMNSDGSVASTNEIVMDGTAAGLNGCIASDSTNRDTGSLEQLAFVGDLDGDGEVTIALGANSNDHPIANSGAVYMLELNSDGTVDNCVLITEGSGGFAPAIGVYRQSGEGQAANFGWPVLATDLNGDGQNELIVGATSDDDTQTDLWPLFLTTGGAVSSHPAIPISGLTIGIDANEYIDDGASISGTKIVVSNQDDGDGGGSIFIVNLSAAGAFSSSTEIAGSSIAGIANDERFGSGLTPLGDMDNDGINDIIVGNEAGDDTNALSGEAHIIYLNADDTLKESQKISNESENTRIGSTPFGASDLLGSAMGLWRDDGTNAVIAIGATQDDTGAEANSGAVHLFYVARAFTPAVAEESTTEETTTTGGFGGSGKIGVDTGQTIADYKKHSNNCDSNQLGTGVSLRVYKIEIDDGILSVDLMTTCGPASVQIISDYGRESVGFADDPVILDEDGNKIAMKYSTMIDKSLSKITIQVKDKRDHFTEVISLYNVKIVREYSGKTGYTSGEQNSQLLLSTPIDISDIIQFESQMPNWVKSDMGKVNGHEARDKYFFETLQYLNDNNYFVFDNWQKSEELIQMEYYPEWVLPIIQMYTDDKISEDEFFNSIKYLVEERIIRIGR